MTVYNVTQAVVELVEADSAEAAVVALQSRLDRAGFNIYENGDAFESEPDATSQVTDPDPDDCAHLECSALDANRDKCKRCGKVIYGVH